MQLPVFCWVLFVIVHVWFHSGTDETLIDKRKHLHLNSYEETMKINKLDCELYKIISETGGYETDFDECETM